jgi:hypothetical protein
MQVHIRRKDKQYQPHTLLNSLKIFSFAKLPPSPGPSIPHPHYPNRLLHKPICTIARDYLQKL